MRYWQGRAPAAAHDLCVASEPRAPACVLGPTVVGCVYAPTSKCEVWKTDVACMLLVPMPLHAQDFDMLPPHKAKVKVLWHASPLVRLMMLISQASERFQTQVSGHSFADLGHGASWRSGSGPWSSDLMWSCKQGSNGRLGGCQVPLKDHSCLIRTIAHWCLPEPFYGTNKVTAASCCLHAGSPRVGEHWHARGWCQVLLPGAWGHWGGYGPPLHPGLQVRSCVSNV